MKDIFQPSLVRRVVLALLAGFFLVLLALVSYELFNNASPKEQETKLREFGENLLLAVESTHQASEAAFLVRMQQASLDRTLAKRNIPTSFRIQLWDRSGQRVFPAESAAGVDLKGTPGRIDEQHIDGDVYRVFFGERGDWRLALAQKYPSLGWMLARLARDLLPYLLIAFPFALLPIWLVVRRGLAPLRDMSRRIAARSADDLSPTGLVPVHAEMKPLAHAIDDLLSRLREKVARETALVQEAAHELRTPMAVISAQAHVLAKAQEPEARLEAEQRLVDALGRSSHLVGQLLQLAYIGGERALDPVRLDLSQVVQAELALLAPSAMARSLDLSLDAPDALPCSMELHTFRSILQNLVGNAIRYVHAGGTIVVTLERQADRVVLTVADDGPGITEDQKHLVFERFHRGTDHAAHGAGLGLAIVKQACVRLGGGVHLEQGTDGRGCVFVVSVPV